MQEKQNNVVKLHTNYLGPMAKVLGHQQRKPGPLSLDDLKTAIKLEIAGLFLPAIDEAVLEHLIEATLYQLAQGVIQAEGADLGHLGRFESITREVANTYAYTPFGEYPDDIA